MKIVYCCYGGSHSSVTAAAIHLGFLPSCRLPTTRELLDLPYYDQQVAENHGKFYLMGQDGQGNDVYIVGKHNLANDFERIIRQFAGIFHIPQEDLMIINTMPYVNLVMMIGGYTSRRLGWPFIGQPIVAIGTKNAYWKLAAVVSRVQVMSRR